MRIFKCHKLLCLRLITIISAQTGEPVRATKSTYVLYLRDQQQIYLQIRNIITYINLHLYSCLIN